MSRSESVSDDFFHLQVLGQVRSYKVSLDLESDMLKVWCATSFRAVQIGARSDRNRQQSFRLDRLGGFVMFLSTLRSMPVFWVCRHVMPGVQGEEDTSHKWLFLVHGVELHTVLAL